ncbi:MAG: dihydrolipoyl dehydrogenase [Phycisphaerales bacterium]|nr:dihydrolipoyl dehydrogenase [Phycisphaerales bacterium]MCB9854820.1 dihydrolipoyl dehydrogenase [Phycisphaerales bacterium]MCB9863708.1 dihydrolipoyl dehydrogenase [Phycisphaerales bacterium]
MVVGELTQEFDVLVIGGGPGGYVAAIAAADAGFATAIVEMAEVPGGVCLREGCIPSKTLLNVVRIMDEAEHAAAFGVTFAKPKTDVDKLRDFKNGVIKKLSTGVRALLKGRKVEYFKGHATFESSKLIHIEGENVGRIKFKHCILATGSRAKMLPEKLLPRELCWNAADALKMEEVPKKLLVIGGGYIGLELGQVYAGLGSEVTVVEALPGILNGLDPDLAKPLVAKLKKQMKAIHVSASFKSAKKKGNGVEATFTVDGKDQTETFDRILVSIGRQPNTDNCGLENTSVQLTDRGFVKVDKQMRSTDKRIFAIGDIAGDPMLAHKAMREAKVAVDVIAGKPAEYDNVCIPAVVYTDPEVAWCGLTEQEAKDKGLDFKVTKSPWLGNGRAVSMGRTEGLTKMLFDKTTQRVLGLGIVGAHAGDMISEGVLAMEMGAVAEDIAVAIHAHPSTGETIGEAAEAMFGKAIHGAH